MTTIYLLAFVACIFFGSRVFYRGDDDASDSKVHSNPYPGFTNFIYDMGYKKGVERQGYNDGYTSTPLSETPTHPAPPYKLPSFIDPHSDFAVFYGVEYRKGHRDSARQKRGYN